MYHVVLLYVCKVRVWRNSTTQECGHHWWSSMHHSHYCRNVATATCHAWISALRQEEVVIVHAYFVGNHTNLFFFLFFNPSPEAFTSYLSVAWPVKFMSTQQSPLEMQVFQSSVIKVSQAIHRLYRKQEGPKQTLQRSKYLLCLIILYN